MNVDVRKINKGDKVKIILYGLPESGWLEVTDVHVNSGLVQVRVPSPGTGPDGGEARWLYPNDRTALFTAHEPAARVHPDAYAREQRWREEAEAERDEARADLAAFRAGVEDLRNDVPSLTDYQIDQRLSAILDRADQ